MVQWKKSEIVEELTKRKAAGTYFGRLSGSRTALYSSLSRLLKREVKGSSLASKKQRLGTKRDNKKSIVEEEIEPKIVLGPPRSVLIRDDDDPSFCLLCTGRLNEGAGEYEIELKNKSLRSVKTKYVWPVEQSLNLLSSRAAGDIGRRIACYYPPEDKWYVGKIQAWASSKNGVKKSTFGVHTVRMEVNDDEEDIILDSEKFVWMDQDRASPTRHRRGTKKFIAGPASAKRIEFDGQSNSVIAAPGSSGGKRRKSSTKQRKGWESGAAMILLVRNALPRL